MLAEARAAQGGGAREFASLRRSLSWAREGRDPEVVRIYLRSLVTIAKHIGDDKRAIRYLERLVSSTHSVAALDAASNEAEELGNIIVAARFAQRALSLARRRPADVADVGRLEKKYLALKRQAVAPRGRR